MSIEIRIVTCMRKNGGFAVKEVLMEYAERTKTVTLIEELVRDNPMLHPD